MKWQLKTGKAPAGEIADVGVFWCGVREYHKGGVTRCENCPMSCSNH
ncbi:MAG: hypothetical protein KDA91_02410 [Planctomycetaceae bacterium]|nr:hypothetical protein [Planctomycetaceae bacterium]